MKGGRRLGSAALIAAAALLVGFASAAQVRAQLIPTGDRVGRSQALLKTVSDLDRANSAHRQDVSRLKGAITDIEARQASRDAATKQLQDDVVALRAHAGESRLQGPGVSVSLADGRVSASGAALDAHLVSYQDVQDVANLLFAARAEGVAVNGHRITPISYFNGSGGALIVDQGPPLVAPFQILAVGNRTALEQGLNDPSALGDLRYRVRQYGIQVSWQGSPSVSLPATDSSLEETYAQPG
jgi:uncharacterized protein YlxW (UPF0749 family)